MWAVTFNGKPVTLQRIFDIEDRVAPWSVSSCHLQIYLTAPRKAQAVEAYLHWIGYTWKERLPGIDVTKWPVVRS